MCEQILELLRYVDYIGEEKVNIQCFVSVLPDNYKEKIKFMEHKTLDDAIHKARYCYDQNKNQSEENHSRKENFKGKYDQQKRKIFKFYHYKNQPKNDP